MKKIKSLIAITGLTSLAVAAIPAVSSCTTSADGIKELKVEQVNPTKQAGSTFTTDDLIVTAVLDDGTTKTIEYGKDGYEVTGTPIGKEFTEFDIGKTFHSNIIYRGLVKEVSHKVTRPISGKGIVALEDSAYIVGNEYQTFVLFQTLEPLEDGQTVEVKAEKESTFITSVYDIQRSEYNSVITLRVSKRDPYAQDEAEIFTNLDFTVKNKDGSAAWTYTIQNYRYLYTTIADISADDRKSFVASEEATVWPYHTYEFDLKTAEGIDPTRINAEILNQKAGTGTGANGSLSIVGSPVVQNNKLYLTIQWTWGSSPTPSPSSRSFPGIGSSKKFDIKLSYLDDHELPIITPVTLTNFELAFQENNREIPQENLVWNADKTVLEGIDWNGVASDVNTLVLPARDVRGGEKTYKIADDAFTSLSQQAHRGVKILKFSGLGCTQIGARAFQGARLRFVDLSALQSDVIIENIVLGENSLAFATAAYASGDDGYGKIGWPEDLSFYKKHILKEKFYNAGIQNFEWYDYTEVEDEQALRQVAWTGGNIKVHRNIKLTQPLDFVSTSAVLDLNGFKITQDKAWWDDDKYNRSMIGVWDSHLIITDSYQNSTRDPGEIRADDTTPAYDKKGNKRFNYCVQARSDNPDRFQSTLTICGGHFIGNQRTIYNWNCNIYIESLSNYGLDRTAPEFYINNTTTTNTEAGRYMLNCHDTTYSAEKATFHVSGGKFFDGNKLGAWPEGVNPEKIAREFNPAESYAESETPISLLDTGYESNRDEANLCYIVSKAQ